MRSRWLLILCLGLSLGPGCGRKEKPAAEAPVQSSFQKELIARVHFAGIAQIVADTNFTGLGDIWLSPQTAALKEQTLQKLARAPYEFLRPRLGENTNDFAALIHPLLDDLLREESCLEVRGVSNATPELALAVHLDAARAQVWKTSLATILRSWTHLPTKDVQVGGAAGWKLKKHVAPNLVRVVQAGEWIVVGVGEDELPLQADLVRRVQTQQRPVPPARDYWLSAQVDWPRLAPWVKLPANIELPPARLKTFGQGGNLRIEAVMNYPTNHEWKLEPWRVPTNTIHEPLVSFTAMRGIGPWMSAQPWVQRQKIETVPNQLYCWALAEIPFQTFVAVPMPDASNVVRRLGAQLALDYNASLQRHDVGVIQFQTNGSQVTWTGLPFIAPFVQAASEPAGEFLLAGLFANAPKSAPLPPELLAQLDRTNLLYYDWETTRERLRECRTLNQLFLIVSERLQLDPQSAASLWLDALGSKGGDAATEVAQTAPGQLTLVRKAPVGLNSMELTLLADWLEATNFPWGFHLPGPLKPKRDGAPSGPPPL